MTGSRPLRFLLLVCAGWTALRVAFLSPAWWAAPAAATAAAPAPVRPVRTPASRPAPLAHGPFAFTRIAASRPGAKEVAVRRLAQAPGAPAATQAEIGPPAAAPVRLPPSAAWPVPPPPLGILRASGRRLSGYGWAFLRDAGAPGLAPGGTLGGAQAGVRALYRLNGDPARPLAVSVRVSSPIGSIAGAEAALGLDWQPSRRVPLHLLAERRQKLGREGRSAFGLTLYGGVSDARLGPLRVDGYAQAGIVGARSRDLFGDGSLRVSLPLGRAGVGAGAWAAAQPGVERVDLGPQASLRLPLAGRSVTLAADWRLRVAGNARPGSGPTLTLATDF